MKLQLINLWGDKIKKHLPIFSVIQFYFLSSRKVALKFSGAFGDINYLVECLTQHWRTQRKCQGYAHRKGGNTIMGKKWEAVQSTCSLYLFCYILGVLGSCWSRNPENQRNVHAARPVGIAAVSSLGTPSFLITSLEGIFIQSPFNSASAGTLLLLPLIFRFQQFVSFCIVFTY